MKKPAYKEKACDHCSEMFTPVSGKQKWCKLCRCGRSSEHRIQRYKISARDWDRMLLEQNGVCKLCERQATRVDHDHVTGIVRGLLCNRCNIALACIDIVGWAERAHAYVLVVR